MGTSLPARVLIVEDNAALARTTQRSLDGMDLEIEIVESAEDALVVLQQTPVDVALLDIWLGGMSGVELMGEIKSRWPDTEVILLTANADVDTAIAAVQHSAVDYIRKPFDRDTLRDSVIKALGRAKRRNARRHRVQELRTIADELDSDPNLPEVDDPAPAVLRVGDLILDQQTRMVIRAGQPCEDLTQLEFVFLGYLMRHANEALSHEQLARETRGAAAGDVRSFCKSIVYGLRRKLADDGADPQVIVAVRGIGYKLRS